MSAPSQNTPSSLQQSPGSGYASPSGSVASSSFAVATPAGGGRGGRGGRRAASRGPVVQRPVRASASRTSVAYAESDSEDEIQDERAAKAVASAAATKIKSPPVPAPPPPPVRIKAAPPPQPSPATLAASSAPPTPAAAGADPRPTPAAVGQPSLAHAHHQQHPGFAGEMGGALVKKKLAKVPGAGGPNDPSGIAVMGRSSRNKPSALLKPRPGGGECPACGVLTADRWHNLPGVGGGMHCSGCRASHYRASNKGGPEAGMEALQSRRMRVQSRLELQTSQRKKPKSKNEANGKKKHKHPSGGPNGPDGGPKKPKLFKIAALNSASNGVGGVFGSQNLTAASSPGYTSSYSTNANSPLPGISGDRPSGSGASTTSSTPSSSGGSSGRGRGPITGGPIALSSVDEPHTQSAAFYTTTGVPPAHLARGTPTYCHFCGDSSAQFTGDHFQPHPYAAVSIWVLTELPPVKVVELRRHACEGCRAFLKARVRDEDGAEERIRASEALVQWGEELRGERKRKEQAEAAAAAIATLEATTLGQQETAVRAAEPMAGVQEEHQQQQAMGGLNGAQQAIAV